MKQQMRLFREILGGSEAVASPTFVANKVKLEESSRRFLSLIPFQKVDT